MGFGTQGWGIGSSGDGQGPVIANLAPSPGELGSPDVPITFNVQDPSGDLSEALIWVQFDALEDARLVYDGDAFKGSFANGSQVQIVTAGSDLAFTVFRNGGWPSAFDLTLTIVTGPFGS